MAETLVVIRSGMTTYDMHGRIRGTLEVPLCEQGIEEAEQIANELLLEPPDVLATSADPPSYETARIIGRRNGLDPRSLSGLSNIDLGLWQGSLVDDIRSRQPRLYRLWKTNPWTIAPPKGETLDMACRRVEAVLERLLRKVAPKRVAVVLPDPLDRVARWLAMGQPIGNLWQRPSQESGIVTVALAGQWGGAGRPASVVSGV
jgi:broad specificity phosphatase PhoE